MTQKISIPQTIALILFFQFFIVLPTLIGARFHYMDSNEHTENDTTLTDTEVYLYCKAQGFDDGKTHPDTSYSTCKRIRDNGLVEHYRIEDSEIRYHMCKQKYIGENRGNH